MFAQIRADTCPLWTIRVNMVTFLSGQAFPPCRHALALAFPSHPLSSLNTILSTPLTPHTPIPCTGLLSNGGMPHDMVRRLTRFLQAPYPFFWDRFQGADHVFWYTGALSALGAGAAGARGADRGARGARAASDWGIEQHVEDWVMRGLILSALRIRRGSRGVSDAGGHGQVHLARILQPR